MDAAAVNREGSEIMLTAPRYAEVPKFSMTRAAEAMDETFASASVRSN